MVAFYKHDIPSWMDGTEALSDGAYRAYHVVVQLIYLNEGPITLNEHGIAGRCRQSVRTFKIHLDELIAAGKLRLENGKLLNSRAEKELEKIDENRVNAGKGGVNSGKSRRGVSKSLKDKEAGEAPLQEDRSLKDKTRLEETRQEDAAPNGAHVPEILIPADADYYRRSKQILGERSGGFAKKLLDAKGGNIPLARAALETASTKSDPREYLGAIIRGREHDETKEAMRLRGDAW